LRLTYFEEELLGQQNIYGLFLLKSSACLHQNGQLIFIVPRSITSGIYFESIRNILLKRLKINQVHIFKSRKDSFTKDKVLQENIIIHAELLASKKSDSIIISQTTGINDFDEIKVKVHNQSRIIKRLGRSNIIHLPTNSDEEEAMEIIKDWKHNLSDFNLQVSTGPVVAYRATKFSSNFKRKYSVPLLWLHNCNQFKINWPKKFKDKPQWISTNKVSDSKTIANKNYVLIRRTTSKESPTLVQASAFHKNEFEFDEIGIENHLNYIHRKDGFISDNVILGLTAFYNSVIFDLYFRTVCGSTQINATDLNNISIPDIELIRELGSQLANCEKINRETSENIINSVIGVELTI
jgi:adenine-specific DNA-methyltransferase